MTALDDFIENLQQNKLSPAVEPVRCNIDLFVAALQELGASAGVTVQSYVPVASALSNMDAVSSLQGRFIRLGNYVTVWGKGTIDPTAGGTASFELTLPVASNITNADDLRGVFNPYSPGGAQNSGGVFGSVANDTAVFQIFASVVGAFSIAFMFSYPVA